MNRTARTMVNVASGYVRLAVTALVVFFLIPVMIEVLGQSNYGLWSLVFAVAAMLGLVDFGMLTSVVKFVAQSFGRQDIHYRNRVVSTAAAIYFVLSMIAIVGIVAVAKLFVPLFDIPPEQQQTATALIWIISARVLISSLPLALFRGILHGEQKIAAANAVQMVSIVVYGMAAWLALDYGYGVVVLAWINLAVMLVEHAVYLAWAYRMVRALRICPSLVSWPLLKEMLGFGASQLIVNLATQVRLRADLVIVKLFLSLSAVGIYAVALKVAEQLQFLVKQGLNVVAPLVAELQGAKQHEQIRYIFQSAGKFAVAPALALAVTSYALGHAAITAWVGPEFGSAAMLLAVLLTATVFALLEATASSVLAMTGHHVRASAAASWSAVVNVAASVALIPFFGLNGVALGALVAAVLVDANVLPRHACRCYGIQYGAYMRGLARAVGPPAIAQYTFLILLRVTLHPQSLGAIAVAALSGLTIYALLFWRLSIPVFEKRLLLDRVRSPRARRSHRAAPVERSA